MDTETGLTSPQFHVTVDDHFDTVNTANRNYIWLIKCGFRRGYPAANQIPLEQVRDQVQPVSEVTTDQDQTGDLSPEGEQIPAIRRSTRVTKAPDRLTYEEVGIFEEELIEAHYMAASADPDTMYLHEARKEPDWPKFQNSMQEEIEGQMSHNNFRLKLRSELPPDTQVLPGVWVLKRKRKILTGEVYKWKARLNLDGSRQIKGVHFDQTYAPVASWSIIKFFLVLILSLGWCAVQLDFVQAFTQAPIERPMFMEVPKGYTVSQGDPKDYVLEILANTYGARQAPK